MSSPFSGSLLTKRKHELVEIALALELSETGTKITDLVKNIQAHLENNEDTLSKTPMFKGLYGRRGRHHESDSETPAPDAKPSVTKGRKSVNKALDKVDAAEIPLPESPATRITEAANHTMAVALAPAKKVSMDLTEKVNELSQAVVKYTSKGQEQFDIGVRILRNYLSNPEHLTISAITLELLSLFFHVVQFYDYTIFISSAGGKKGSVSVLLHNLLFWVPSFQLRARLPEVRYDSEVWPALAWWFFTTIFPPFILSHVISFVPQKGEHHGRGRHTQPRATFDPLAFAVLRLVVLLFPLTSAVPSVMVDALEMSGNLQGRALGGGLLVALIIADRLT